MGCCPHVSLFQSPIIRHRLAPHRGSPPPPPEEQRSRAGPGAGAMRWGRPSGAGSDAGGAERSCSPPQPLYPDPDLPPPRPGRPRAPPRRGNFAARPQSSLPAGSRARGEWGRDEEEEKEEEQRVPKKGL